MKLINYFTNHHSPSHHKRLRPSYLHSQADHMIRHNTKHPVLRGCDNLCTTSQTENANIPRLGPHPCDYTGVPTQAIVPTLRPPFSSTGQGNAGSTAMLKGHREAPPRYSALRVNQPNTESCNITLHTCDTRWAHTNTML
jgi:hypothetical protein